MNILIKRLRENAVIPEYQTYGAAAMDISACLETSVIIQPGKRLVVPTGFALELPKGFEAQIRARSGLSLKYGICLANGIGTIDCDFRGEVGVILINLGDHSFTIEPGMRVAQMVIAKYEQIVWQETNLLSHSERGEKGFGSTKH